MTRRGSLPKSGLYATWKQKMTISSIIIVRCSEQNAVSKIKCSIDLKTKDDENKYHAAAKVLEVILSGATHDIFALDLYYHKTCYDNLTMCMIKKNTLLMM